MTFKGGKSALLPSSARNVEQTLWLLNVFVHFYRLMKMINAKHPVAAGGEGKANKLNE